MLAGRKPKPSQLRLVEGNREHRPIPNTPKPKPHRRPAPTWMDHRAKREWHRISRTLYKMGLLTDVDTKALEAYCVCYSKWREATEKTKVGILTTPAGYAYANPLIAVELKYSKEMRAWMAEFGLTPSARSRITIEEPDDEDEDLD